MEDDNLIIIRGAGDIATATICRLYNCGFRLLVLETENPSAIRRRVSLSEAVYDGQQTVEGVTAERISELSQRHEVWNRKNIPLFIDPCCSHLHRIQAGVIVDAIVGKKNFGTYMAMAPYTIALGPGFHAGRDVHCVIETARGHNLGRLIHSGPPLPNSGVPGDIQGYSRERVVHASVAGILEIKRDIGSAVQKGEIIARIGTIPVHAPLTGLVRGMIRDRFRVKENMKIADVDPRMNEPENCFTISDKARCISGGVLEALLSVMNRAHP
ncbi:selenium-dependent molybdenum cofactor biosynthesis protein YqeB [Desulfopila sp. IMCC35008]|uniref:selenium-dependent molybdenum cofactor biosynthesis protein YqeB n=1 Tax=Desulfopila sp. IMCC35008 TaxID=2653858 RepID=UPI0013CFDFAC|nr:selenium-dependent molybdenum cofactor biosynthesis protein YqeB [Desulfopila sp. IMCC35008]